MKYKLCELCEVDYANPAECLSECTVKQVILDGKLFDRLVYTELQTPCHDCGTRFGGTHHMFCDFEKCPACSEQLLFCDCTTTFPD